MLNLKEFQQNIYHNAGLNECPHYGEDGVILKIFEKIKPSKKPLIIEFGETRSLGTTTRSFRIKYKSRAIYFTGDLSIKSTLLNILDVLKITVRNFNFQYLKFLFNLPFKYFVTPNNIIELFEKNKVDNIDILTIDIDSYDYFIAKKILENSYMPKLLILEYNYSLGYKNSITFPFPVPECMSTNKRAFGASYNALFNLASSFNYKLIHISGFCNLFFIRNDYKDYFLSPDLNTDLIKNNDDIIKFLKNHCQKGFIPSWFNEQELKDSDLINFIHVD